MTQLSTWPVWRRLPVGVRLSAVTAVCAAGVLLLSGSTVGARDVPSRLGDNDFWRLVTSFSEGGGQFPSDNFVSNEIEYQTAIPRLTGAVRPGGVYVGVGPDQNFTYITALQPRLAFIVDIRRQNLLHHLLYKAIIEVSPTRAAFLSRLFGRAPPADLENDAPVDVLFDAIADAPWQPDLFERYLAAVLDRLERHHRFVLAADDRDTIRYVYETFYNAGPDISYASMPGRIVTLLNGQRLSISPNSPYPTFAELTKRHDGTGVNRSYLASEVQYKLLREMQLRNAIVPVVGDFAGPKALREVGRYVRDKKARVTAFYTSNVEQYLFQNQVWRTFYENVASLPLDESSHFIRSDFQARSSPVVVYGPWVGPPVQRVLRPSLTLIYPIQEQLAAVADGRIRTYRDVVAMSR